MFRFLEKMSLEELRKEEQSIKMEIALIKKEHLRLEDDLLGVRMHIESKLKEEKEKHAQEEDCEPFEDE